MPECARDHGTGPGLELINSHVDMQKNSCLDHKANFYEAAEPKTFSWTPQ